MCARGDVEARFIKVESEHSAMAALVGASSAGVRTFTATSGNGLLLMHEVLHWAAGARLPIVLANVNRAVSGGWNIWADQTDSLSQRDTGWLQIYCESNQEVLDSIIMAYKLAEKVSVPTMIAYDAFYLSHTSEIVDVPEIEQVDEFLPRYIPKARPEFDDPRMFGGFVDTEYFYEQRYAMHRASLDALHYYPEACREFKHIFGREYDIVEEYEGGDAEAIVVTAGTISSVARIAIERMRKEGKKIGLMKLRMFRPVPAERWQEVLGKVPKVIVIDRNISAGLGGVFSSEIQAALYPLEKRPVVYPVIAGIGGRDITPADVEGIVDYALSNGKPTGMGLCWGLKQ